MQYPETIILLPCHSLEDFPLHHEGAEAEGLLAGWTALWHPVLLDMTGSLPTWSRIDDPPDELSGRLLVIPAVSAGEMPTGFDERAKQEGAVLIREVNSREEILRQALDPVTQLNRQVDAELVADFLGLGYCYLQVELLTRQMRYASNLDELHFKNQVVAAARAAVAQDASLCQEKLTACFDILAEERDHYYPVDAFLVDLNVVADTTIGSELRGELSRETPLNLLVSGDVIQNMARQEPSTLAAIGDALAADRACIVGGESTEHPLPLMSGESILRELRRGRQAYETHLGRRPSVFGRRRFGLTPVLPQLLTKTGFEGAVHATLDDGRFPEGMQIKTRWEGPDGLAIDALARAPLEAIRPETYLNLAVKMGESMDMDHVATICLAHWPGQTCDWLEDLRRIARYTSALGKFVTLDAYFRDTDDPHQSDRFTADQYRSPYLKQAIAAGQPDAISSFMRFWRRSAQADLVQWLKCLSQLISGDAVESTSDLHDAVDADLERKSNPDLDATLTSALHDESLRLAELLPRAEESPQSGYLVINPFSFVRRMCVDVGELDRLPAIDKPVYAADETPDGKKHVVVDVPPMGFVWLTSSSSSAAKRKRRETPLLAEDCTEQDGFYVLRNEFFEVLIDPATGALRSLYEYQTRGNRLSQQLGFRLPGGAPPAAAVDDDESQQAAQNYSVMSADEIQVTSSNSALGEIVVRGKLMDRSGTPLADYHQIYRLSRGSRLLTLRIELEPHIEPGPDPWGSYFAVRFAWADEGAELYRSVNGTRQPVSAKRFEAPQYIDIANADGKRNTSILTGGLPYHHRRGLRMLDSILIVQGETARQFELAIGVDLPRPLQEATSFLAPPICLAQRAAQPVPASSGWLFHIDARNVMATHWEPVFEDGSVAGFRVRLVETAGRSSRATLQSFRPVAQARQVDFQNKSMGQCTVDNGRIRLDFAAGEWVELEARW